MPFLCLHHLEHRGNISFELSAVERRARPSIPLGFAAYLNVASLKNWVPEIPGRRCHRQSYLAETIATHRHRRSSKKYTLYHFPFLNSEKCAIFAPSMGEFNDIAQMLALLHDLQGIDFVRQLRLITERHDSITRRSLDDNDFFRTFIRRYTK